MVWNKELKGHKKSSRKNRKPLLILSQYMPSIHNSVWINIIPIIIKEQIAPLQIVSTTIVIPPMVVH